MEEKKVPGSVLISVYHKTGLESLLEQFQKSGAQLISTGGTAEWLRTQKYSVTEVSSLTDFPEILEGRVKTLHPVIFGGILAKRNTPSHSEELTEHHIQEIDFVVVDLYPFEEALKNPETTPEQQIEKIDIGGVALIRAAAKNHDAVAVISHSSQYSTVSNWLKNQPEGLTLSQRKQLAGEAFAITADYDQLISTWFQQGPDFIQSLRYGENPHQSASWIKNPNDKIEILSGKALSYNNLLDLEAGISLIREFKSDSSPVFAILKHTQPCGVALGSTVSEAWERALQSDPTSAFGGILITNTKINLEVAQKIKEIFFEVLCAPDFEPDAFALLSTKTNRILIKDSGFDLPENQYRSLWSGSLEQSSNLKISAVENRKLVSGTFNLNNPDIAFAEICVKHLKSNAIAIVNNGQLIGKGSGRTSRVEAVKGALESAAAHNFSVKGSILASDAFFPFPDSLKMAADAGISCILQPGGSIKDEENIQFCNDHHLSMIFTGIRHFKH